jgi:hypothetical protein
MAVEVVLCKARYVLSSYCGTSTSLNGNLGGEIRSHEMIRAKAELLDFKKGGWETKSAVSVTWDFLYMHRCCFKYACAWDRLVDEQVLEY